MRVIRDFDATKGEAASERCGSQLTSLSVRRREIRKRGKTKEVKEKKWFVGGGGMKWREWLLE